MASLYVFEIDGWGEVGPRSAVTQSQGFADGSFQLTTATVISSEETGAMCWVEDCSIVPDGYYTYTAKGAGVMTLQAAPDVVTVATVAVSGFVRVEDHFRISDGVPDWVTGAAALARWHTDLVAVSHSAGQRISPYGGIAGVDGLQVVTGNVNLGLAAVSRGSYLYDTLGPVTVATGITAAAQSVSAYSAAPFAGESATSPTASAQPAWFSNEAVDVRGTASSSSTSGRDTYTVTDDGSSTFVTRGVLRTEARSHIGGTVIFGKVPTAIGQTCRTFVYEEGHASHAFRRQEVVALCEGSKVDSLGNRQMFKLASQLLNPARKTLEKPLGFYSRALPTNAYTSPLMTSEAEQYTDSEWTFCLDGLCAQAITRTSATPSEIGDNGERNYPYTATRDIEVRSDFPMIRPAKSDDVWQIFNSDQLGKRFRYNGGEGISTEGGAIADADGVVTSTRDATVETARFVAPRFPLCHVFFPVTWTADGNDFDVSFSSPRYVDVSPVDVALTVITSTGTIGANGAHDLAPRELGLAIPLDQVEVDTFTTIGNRLQSEGCWAQTVFMDEDSNGSVADWLDKLLRAYALGLVTTIAGKVRLVDMAVTDYTSTKTLTEANVVGAPAVNPVYELNPRGSLETVSLKYPRPWVRPSEIGEGIEQIVRQDPNGVSGLFAGVQGDSVTVETDFALSSNILSQHALGLRWSRMIAQSSGLAALFSVDVDPAYVADVGDVISVTLANLPNVANAGGMDGVYCRVDDRVHESRPVGEQPRDTLTLRVFEASRATQVEWAPSAQVDVVTSSTAFTVEAAEFHGGDYTSDATSFADGATVHFYDENLVRLTTIEGTVGSTSVNAVTLSTAAQDGGGPFTPSTTDIMLLAELSAQGASIAEPFAWISATTPGRSWPI